MRVGEDFGDTLNAVVFNFQIQYTRPMHIYNLRQIKHKFSEVGNTMTCRNKLPICSSEKGKITYH